MTDPTGETVSARGVFTLDQIAGTLSVQLINQLENEVSVGQAITGFSFGMTGGLANLTGAFGDQISVASNGVISDLGTNPQSALLNWRATTSSGIITVSDLGNGQPKQSILGSATNGVYGSANASIAGNKPHNAFVSEMATFAFNGVTGNLATGTVRIGFGTDGTNYKVATLIPETLGYSGPLLSVGSGSSLDIATPEPATWLVLLTGLAGLCRRCRQSPG